MLSQLKFLFLRIFLLFHCFLRLSSFLMLRCVFRARPSSLCCRTVSRLSVPVDEPSALFQHSTNELEERVLSLLDDVVRCRVMCGVVLCCVVCGVVIFAQLVL